MYPLFFILSHLEKKFAIYLDTLLVCTEKTFSDFAPSSVRYTYLFESINIYTGCHKKNRFPCIRLSKSTCDAIGTFTLIADGGNTAHYRVPKKLYGMILIIS